MILAMNIVTQDGSRNFLELIEISININSFQSFSLLLESFSSKLEPFSSVQTKSVKLKNSLVQFFLLRTG
jgi:hypothetical protein